MTYDSIDKLASAIRNDVYSGLRGYHTNLSLNYDQLKDDIIDERLQIIKEYALKGILPYKDLLLSINCIDVDCKNIEKCRCKSNFGTPTAHFEIPQIVNDFEDLAIDYIGTIDKETQFNYYTSLTNKNIHKYKRRKQNKPFVWIDITPNNNGMYDCFIFNAPLIKTISIVAVFKDPRQLANYSCCVESTDDNFSWINNEIKKRLTQKKLMFYRQYATPITPNDQSYE